MSRKRLIVISLISLPLLVLLMAGGLIFTGARTDFGREIVRQQIETLVSQDDGLKLSMGPIGGDLLSSFDIAEIVLSDSEGEWLVARQLEINWSPLDLLNKSLSVGEIKLNALELLREPLLPPSPPSSDASESLIPSLPVDVTLQALEIRRIHIHEALAGQEAVFQLGVSLNAPSDERIRSKIDLQQLEGGQAVLAGLVEFHPGDETLGVDITLSEPQNGLLARTLELPDAPAVEVSILGDGAISSWQGQILAKAGDLLDGDLIVATAVNGNAEAREITIGLQGHSRFSALLPDEFAALADPTLEIESDLVWSEKNQTLSLTQATLESSALRVNAEGSYALQNETLTARVKVTPLNAEAFSSLIAPAQFRAGEVNISATGNLQSIKTDIDLILDGLAVPNEIAIEQLTGRLQTNLSPDRPETLPLKGEVRLSSVSGLPPEAAVLLGEQLDLDFTSELDIAENQLSLSKFNALGAGFALSGSAELGLLTQAVDADLSLELTDLSLLAPAVGQAISGRLKIDTSLEAENIAEQATVKLRAVSEGFDPGDAELKALIGETVEVTAAVDTTTESISVKSLDVTTAFATLAATGELPLTFDSIAAEFSAKADDLSPLQDLAGVTLTGSAKIDGTLSGPLDNPAVTGTADIERLQVDSLQVGELTSQYEVLTLVSGPKGTLKSRLIHPKATADLATDFALSTPDRLDLNALSLKVADAAITGDLAIPLDGMPITGSLKGEIPDLAALAGLADQTTDGAVNFTADLIASENRQDAQIAIDAIDLRLDSTDPQSPKVASLTATLIGRDLLQTPSFEANASAANAGAGDFNLDDLNFDADGTDEAVDFTFELRKAAEPALSFDGSGSAAITADTLTLGLAALEGLYEDRPVELLAPLEVRQTGPQTQVKDFKLRLDGGEIAGSALLDSNTASAQIALKELPLDLLMLLEPQLASSGALDGQAEFSFADGKAAGRFQFDAKGAKPKDDDFANLPALNGQFSGTLKDERLTFDAAIAGLEGTSVDANGFLPLDVTLDPFAATAPANEPLEANAKLKGDLAKLWPLLEVDEHLLAGQFTADVQARGNLANPKLQGNASLSEGRYESLELGTLLTAMVFSAELDALDSIKLSFSASDGDNGDLSADGKITLPSDGKEAVIDIDAKLSKARLLRRDDILAQASGDLQVDGTPSSLAVTGDVATDLVEINIGGDLPASIVELPVEERNLPTEAAAERHGKDQKDASSSTTKLKLSLSLPRRVFIRGRGLDSEWSGQFKITGTADAPIIEGDLSPVRGNFTFAGKSFALQNGKVTIAGGDEIDPELDLSAVYEANGFKAIVSITGTASSPEIALSSEPELPQDEILAQVLFGKSTGQLSPVEALQLAEAVASVSGQLGSGEGILGLVRKTIGVDVLTAGTNETSGEVEVRAGKYVTDDVFVGVSQGTDPTSTKVTVEVEVTPNISVESDVGQDASGRVGVFWKFDY